MSKDANNSSKIQDGNISFLSSTQKYENLAASFLSSKPIIENEANFYHLGVRQEDLIKVYSKERLNQTQSSRIPKFYRDKENNLRDYNNGQELKETVGEITSSLEDMRKEFGSKVYPSEVRKKVEKMFSDKWPILTRTFDADDKKTRLSNATDSIVADQNNEMKSHLGSLKNNVDVNDETRLKINHLLDSPRTRFQYEVADFVAEVKKTDPRYRGDKLTEIIKLSDEDKRNSPPKNATTIMTALKALAKDTEIPTNIKKQVSELLLPEAQKFQRDVGKFLSEIPAGVVSDDLQKLKNVHQESPNVRLKKFGGEKNDYHEVLSEIKGVRDAVLDARQMLKNSKTLKYAAVTPIKGAVPNEQELQNGLARAVFEQQKLTGLNPSSKEFKTEIDKMSNKQFDNMVMEFENQTSGEVKKYTIDTSQFKAALSKINKIPNDNIPFDELTLDQRKAARAAINEQLSGLDVSSVMKPEDSFKTRMLNSIEKASSKISSALGSRLSLDNKTVNSAKTADKTQIPISVKVENIVFPEEAHEALVESRAKGNPQKILEDPKPKTTEVGHIQPLIEPITPKSTESLDKATTPTKKASKLNSEVKKVAESVKNFLKTESVKNFLKKNKMTEVGGQEHTAPIARSAPPPKKGKPRTLIR